MTTQELKLRLTADISGAQKGLSDAGEHVNKLGSIVKTVIAGAAVAAVASFGKQCLTAAGEAEQGEVLLRNSLGNIKGMTDKAKDSAVSWVNAMESSKSFDDSEISASLQQLTVKTGALAKGQEAVSVAMEVARFKHIDLAAATTLVDQAYNGSARALKQFGLEAGPDGKPIKGMTALNALQEKVKGSGDAWSKTLEGQKAAMATTFGNFQETVGAVLMPLATELMKQIMPLLTQAMKWITDHMPEIQKVITDVVNGISKAFEIGGKIINGVVDTIKWIIDHAKQAIDWVKGVQGASDTALGSKGDTLSTGRYTAFAGVGAHANGGWVGLNGPEIALVGEKGPEYITPAGQTGASDSLLRELIQEVHALRKDTAQQTRGFAAAVQGMAR